MMKVIVSCSLLCEEWHNIYGALCHPALICCVDSL